MKISFVIPAYLEEKSIGACIESVQKALKAEPVDSEILVVVNGEKRDRTMEIARGYEGVTVMESEQGLTKARKAGVLASTCGPQDVVAFIDADTRMPERGWISLAVQEFTEDPRLVALSGPYYYYDLNWRQNFFVTLFYLLGYALYLVNRFILKIGSMLQGGNFLVRKDALMRLGGYDTSVEFFGEDTNMAVKLHRLHMGGVKWTWKLSMPTSGRRLAEKGIIKTGFTYALNHVIPIYFGKVATKKHEDFR